MKNFVNFFNFFSKKTEIETISNVVTAFILINFNGFFILDFIVSVEKNGLPPVPRPCLLDTLLGVV